MTFRVKCDIVNSVRLHYAVLKTDRKYCPESVTRQSCLDLASLVPLYVMYMKLLTWPDP